MMAMESGGLSRPPPLGPDLHERTIADLERRLTDLEKRVRAIEGQADVWQARRESEGKDG